MGESTGMGTAVTAVLTQILDSLGDVISTISSTPILAIGVTIFLVGGIIGLGGRLIRI